MLNLKGYDMKDIKKVSIIVPVYNVEKYIKRCVYSLINQDYSNIEIILVDDGSPDKCPDIIDEFAKVDKRIIVIHQTNGGVSNARNAGLKVACGEYIMFVDGDDWVDRDYVSYFVSLLEQSKCEVGFNHCIYNFSSDKSNDGHRMVSAEQAIEWIYSEYIFVAVWNKIYKADFLRNNKLTFCEKIWYGEGMLFNIEALQYVDRVEIGEKCVYHQTFNPNSAMREFRLDSNYCGIASLWLQRSKWKKNNDAIENAWAFHRYRYNRSIINGIVRTDTLRKHYDGFRECKYNLRGGLKIALKNEKSMKKKLGWICYSICPVLMAKRAARKWERQAYESINSDRRDRLQEKF